MRVVIFVLLCVCVVGKPFPEPIPERVFPCTGLQNETICGNNGECKPVIQNNIQTKQCVCDDKYGTLNIDHEPCTRERTSKALAFWLQLFFGWINVGAFVLHWWWFALSIYIVYTIVCCFGCVSVCSSSNDDSQSSAGMGKTCFNCLSCMGSLVIGAMWITNLVYIASDCYFVIETKGTEYSLKCWDNMWEIKWSQKKI